MPTRQTSSSGRPKSPRIQVVLPEELCARLAALADSEARTVSNMARVLIQQGVERLESQQGAEVPAQAAAAPDPSPRPAAPSSPELLAALEQQQQRVSRPVRRGPRRVRLQRPPA